MHVLMALACTGVAWGAALGQRSPIRMTLSALPPPRSRWDDRAGARCSTDAAPVQHLRHLGFLGDWFCRPAARNLRHFGARGRLHGGGSVPHPRDEHRRNQWEGDMVTC